MERLPDTRGLPNEVIMCRAHRTGYDHAIRAAGARIRDVGVNDRGTGAGVRGVEAWEIEAAVGPRTVAIAYTAAPGADPTLPEVVAVAERHRLPVLVDAAAQLPPADNLRRFVAEGASLVAFSGGKAIRGPQATGILCGRAELIAAAALQQLDMDVWPGTWRPPAELIPRERLRGIPRHGIGRGFKAGKEEIVGLLVALERFVGLDHAAEARAARERLEHVAARLEALPGVSVRILAAPSGRVPLLEIQLGGEAAARRAESVSRALQAGKPPVHVGESRLGEGVLLVNPVNLQPGEERAVADALRAALEA
jgi:L-seryl-tRNA(Ser) seleniumtransferase